MRIIGGRLAGRKLVSPGGRVRPTSEEVRDAAMTLVAGELEDAAIIDLFAGSGALGIEALSRGASSCDFVENYPAALHALKANITALKLRDRTRIFKKDAIPFVQHAEELAYDIAFADPPYGSRKVDRIISDWREHPFARLLIVEHAADHPLPTRPTARQRIDDSVVSVFTQKKTRRRGR